MNKEIEKINALKNQETFWEDVRNIVGYYEGKPWSDHEIKELQRVADRRFTHIVLKIEE